MSRTIDERVVEMRFDSKQFEQKIKACISALSELNRTLDMKGATKGLESIDEAAKKIDMTGLGSAVETVRLKFSALEVMAVTALANITNSAINTGKRVISSLTIAPIKSGFQEYETQISAIQTILANTEHEGTNLQQVNRALDELNLYADKTIYNFTQMTKNIGTFTAAGVDLQTSVESIKGIANLAAVSGSTSAQASTAMYQLSQALAAGRVSLMDWNSVVNAGMGGKVFQDALVRTSELLGTGARNAIDTYGSFRESLTKGEWLTTKVLTETLKQFAGAYTEADLISQGFSKEQAESIAKMAETAENAATKVKTFTQLWDTLQESAQSGWTQTWEILIGDFGEAKEVLTAVSDAVGGIIQSVSDARNAVLGGGLSTGWKQLLDLGIADEAGYIDAIQEVARENGDAFDKMIANSSEFTDALKSGLKDGTISSDMLAQAVNRLSKKMIKMTKEECDAAGYTSEMVSQIKELDEGLRSGTISMSEFVKKILKPSGRENLIEGLWNAAKGLISILKPIGEAFKEIFPSITAERIYTITENFRKFTENLKLNDETATNLKDTFKGLFSILDFIKQGLAAAIKVAAPLAKIFGTLFEAALTITGTIGRVVTKFNELIKTYNVFQTIGKAVTTVLNGLATALRFLKDKAFDGISDVIERICARLSGIQETADTVKNGTVNAFETIGSSLANSKFVKILEDVWDTMTEIGNAIIGIVTAIVSGISMGLKNASLDEFSSLLNSASLGAIALAVSKLLSSLRDNFGSITESVTTFTKLKTSIVDTLDAVRGCFENYQKNLKAQILTNIASAMAVLAGALVVIGLIDTDKLNAGLAAITVLFGNMMIFAHFLGNAKLIEIVPKKMISSVIGMIGMASAVLILATALKHIATLDVDQMKTGIIGIAGLAAIIIIVAKVMAKNSAAIIQGTGHILVISAAIGILSIVCKNLADLSWNELAKGVTGLLSMMLMLRIIVNIMQTNGETFLKGATQVLIISGALLVMSAACKQLAQLSWGDLTKGVAGVIAMSASLTLMSKALKTDGSTMLKGASQILVVSLALLVLAQAIKQLGSMDVVDLAKGVGAMAVSMATLIIGLNKLEGAKSGTGALIIAAGALLIMAGSLKVVGSLNTDSIISALVGIGGAMLILVVGLNAMSGTAAGAAALLIAATALLFIAPAIAILGALKITQIAIGLAAIAGVFVIIGAAGAVLAPAVPAIMALGAAVALIGGGFALAGLGLTAFAAGLTALVAVGTTGAATVVATLGVIGKAVIGLIPSIAKAIGEGIVTICKSIADSADAIVDSIFAVIMTLLNVLVEHVPAIVGYICDFIIAVLNGLTEKMPKLIQAAVDFIMAFFSGIIDALGGVDTETLIKGIAGIGLFAALIAGLSAITPLIPGAMIAVVGMGAILAELAIVLAAIGALAQIPGLKWFIDEGAVLLESIGHALGSLVGGIVGGVMEGISSSLPEIASDLSKFMTNLTPFIDGVKSLDPSVLEGVNSITGIILALTAASLIDRLTSWFTGGSAIVDFANDLIPFGEAMAKFSNTISGINPDAVTAAASAGKTLAELADALPNSGGVVSWVTGDNTMDDFGKQLESFGKSIVAFSNSVKGINAETTAGALSIIREVLNIFKDSAISPENISAFTRGFETLGNSGIESFVKSFTDSGTKIKNAVSLFINAFNDAVTAKKTSVADTFKIVIDDSVKAIRDKHSKFKKAGEYLVQGFADGITGYGWYARNAAAKLGESVAEAVRKELDINSPSRVAYGIGCFFGAGLVNAIGDYERKVYSASADLATSAKKGLSGAVSTILSVMNSDIDMQPTIRPIIDLSDVKAGADSIDGMFNRALALGPASNVSIIGSMMNQNQNRVDSDIISAIRDLGKEISGVSGNIYTINGVTYDDGSNVSDAVRALVRAARIERRA